MNEIEVKIDALLTTQMRHLVEMAGSAEVLRDALRAKNIPLATAARNYYGEQMEIVNGIVLEINRLVGIAHLAQQALPKPGVTIQ